MPLKQTRNTMTGKPDRNNHQRVKILLLWAPIKNTQKPHQITLPEKAVGRSVTISCLGYKVCCHATETKQTLSEWRSCQVNQPRNHQQLHQPHKYTDAHNSWRQWHSFFVSQKLWPCGITHHSKTIHSNLLSVASFVCQRWGGGSRVTKGCACLFVRLVSSITTPTSLPTEKVKQKLCSFPPPIPTSSSSYWGGGVARLVKHQVWHTANACSTPWCSKGFFSSCQYSVQVLLWCPHSPGSIPWCGKGFFSHS